jgi:hypothetical protein
MTTESDLTVVCPISMHRGRSGRGKFGTAPAPPTDPEQGNLPRVTRLMALAIKLADNLDAGRIKDLADIARLGSITRARATQIMNLLALAPDIQEAILFLPRTTRGRAPVTERDLRELARLPWREQRDRWNRAAQTKV